MNPPIHLTSFLHSHPLALKTRNPLVPSHTRRTCDVCRESIDGDFYGCNHCHFHVHYYCTRLPNSLRHVIDPKHKLSLLKLSSGRCSVCKADCSSLWVYACTACKVNIHLKCLRKPFGSKKKTDQPSSSRGIHNHHHAQPLPPSLVPGNTSNHFRHHGPVNYQFPHNNHPSYHTNHGGHGHGYGHGHGHGHGYGHGHGHGHGYGHGHGHGHGGHSHGHGHGPSPGFGSVMGSLMFTLVENLAMGALSDFIFGSIEF